MAGIKADAKETATPADGKANKANRKIKPDDGAKVLTACLTRIEQLDPSWQDFVVNSLNGWLAAKKDEPKQLSLPLDTEPK